MTHHLRNPPERIKFYRGPNQARRVERIEIHYANCRGISQAISRRYLTEDASQFFASHLAIRETEQKKMKTRKGRVEWMLTGKKWISMKLR